MRIRWAVRAQRDIAAIIVYVSKHNPIAALDQVRRIERQGGLLAEYPDLGRPGRRPSTRELVVPDTPYLLIYRPHSDVVDILRVIHGAQRWPPRGGGR
jgi:toxin ParE1/3/4